MSDHVISRTVGPAIPKQDQRWRIDEGPPQFETYEAALKALPKLEKAVKLGRRCPFPRVA